MDPRTEPENEPPAQPPTEVPRAQRYDLQTSLEMMRRSMPLDTGPHARAAERAPPADILGLGNAAKARAGTVRAARYIEEMTALHDRPDLWADVRAREKFIEAQELTARIAKLEDRLSKSTAPSEKRLRRAIERRIDKLRRREEAAAKFAMDMVARAHRLRDAAERRFIRAFREAKHDAPGSDRKARRELDAMTAELRRRAREETNYSGERIPQYTLPPQRPGYPKKPEDDPEPATEDLPEIAES